MRHIYSLFITLLGFTNAFSQKTFVSSEILTAKQVTELFSNHIRRTLNINFSIFKVVKYADKAGQYYCILTESQDKITSDKDTFNYKIKAINVKANNGSFTNVWEINDHIIKNEKDETSISFSTMYTDFKDYDGDGLADPIIIYNTSAANGLDDGRIKFIIYYKGQKVLIRHQNAVLDSERETQFDKSFYRLPKLLQENIRQKMELMVKNNQAIFPAGWRTAMKYKRISFNVGKK